MRRCSLAFLAVVIIAVHPFAVGAQTLRTKIGQLFIFGSGDNPLFLAGSADPSNPLSIQVHGSHFVPSAVSQNGSIIAFLTTAIAGSVSNAPVGSTSGGENFRIEGGVPVRDVSSGGPIFAERAQTLGRGRTAVGFRRSSAHYTSLRGEPLSDIQLFFTHENTDPAGCDSTFAGDCSRMGLPTLENDVMQFNLSMDVNVAVNSFYMTYGLSPNVDIGFVVPLVSTSLHAHSTAEIIPFGGPTAAHFFAGTPTNPVLSAERQVDGSSFGIGDIALRTKIGVRQTERTNIGLLADVRFATGDPEQLLGSGQFMARAFAIVSGRLANFSPHANAGYMYRGGGKESDAVLATVGFDNLLMDRLTLAADLVNQFQVGHSKLTLPAPVTYTAPFNRTISPTSIPDMADNFVNGSFGGKYAAGNGWAILANVLFPLNRGGLRAQTTYTTGLEVSF